MSKPGGDRESVSDKELPTIFLLGDRYIKTMQQIAQSNNSRLVVLPSDIKGAVQGLHGRLRIRRVRPADASFPPWTLRASRERFFLNKAHFEGNLRGGSNAFG